MAAAALFIESAGALSKRLSNHCRWLTNKVIEKRHRSTEIVLAFMINVPWMGPGVHSTDDETCWYVSLATTIAIDLQMSKVSMPMDAFKNGVSGDLARQDCMDPELALRLGGFKSVDPNSELGRRLSTVDKFFEQWHLEWGMTLGGSGPQHRLPPYVEVLVTHTRLSIYSSVINHPTAPLEVRHFFRTAGLSAALNVMRAAVQGEVQLFSMPNNTAIMVSFAACFALKLSTQMSGGNSSSVLAPSVRTLIEETADMMEKIGNITKHRHGMGRLYGRYLRLLVKKEASAAETAGPSRHGHGTPRPTAAYTESARQAAGSVAYSHQSNARAGSGAGMSQSGFAIPQPPSAGLSATYDTPGWSSHPSDLFQFSAMSDDQIVEALNRTGGEFDPPGFGSGMGGSGASGGGSGFSWEDAMNFDYMLNWNNLPDYGL
ncbi:hypothetical protein Daus18300_012765 [Diaporthe australafricana]|uniref:Transcription factor domain-containing protein n=1 Tax=Diaporthe australafricana TaxID=127596 RepID=A0ABR3W1M4_9PEZI